MNAKAKSIGISHRVIPFIQWLRATTVALLHIINALTIMDLSYIKL